MKKALCLCSAILLFSGLRLQAQRVETGLSETFSAGILFNPYYHLWIQEHHEADLCIQAAWAEKIRFPFGIQTGYHYFFDEKNWRPGVGVQNRLLFGDKENGKRYYMQMISVVPGLQ